MPKRVSPSGAPARAWPLMVSHTPRMSCHAASSTAEATPALHMHNTQYKMFHKARRPASPHARPPAHVDGAHPLGAVDLVSTDAHEVNLPVVHVDWDLAYCLGSVCVQEHLWAGRGRVVRVRVRGRVRRDGQLAWRLVVRLQCQDHIDAARSKAGRSTPAAQDVLLHVQTILHCT